MKWHKLKKTFLKITILIPLLSLLIGLMPLKYQTKTVSAWSLSSDMNNRATYYLSLTLDPTTHTIQPSVNSDEHSFNGDNNNGYAEAKYAGINWGTGSYGDSNPHPNLISGLDSAISGYNLAKDSNGKELQDKYKSFLKNKLGSDTYNLKNDVKLAFSFPTDPMHSKSRPGDGDIQKANAIGNGVIGDFNRALSLMYSQRAKINSQLDTNTFTRAQFAYLVLYTGSLPSEYFSNPTYSQKDHKYYVTIKDGTAKGSRLIYGQSKGYNADDDVYSKNGRYITWPMIAAEAVSTWANGNVTYDNIQTIAKPDKLTSFITDFFSGLLDSLRTALHIPNIGALIFNLDSRSFENGSFYGIAPVSWYNSTGILMTLMDAIAFFIIAFALAKSLYSYQKQTLTLNERITLQDDIKNLLVTMGLLTIYPWIFFILIRFNYDMVAGLSQLAGGESAIPTLMGSMSHNWLVGILVSFVFFALNVYFYYYYVFRALMILLLNTVAPIYISTLSLGQQYQPTFVNWFKELIGNIYSQLFQALIIAFYMIWNRHSAIDPVTMLLLLFAVLPATRFFRRSMDIGGSMSEELSSGALNAIGSTASSIGGKIFSNNGGNRNNNGGNNNGNNGDNGHDGVDGISSAGSNTFRLDNNSGKAKSLKEKLSGFSSKKSSAAKAAKQFISNPQARQAMLKKGISNIGSATKTGVRKVGSGMWSETKNVGHGIAHSVAAVPGLAKSTVATAPGVMLAAGLSAAGMATGSQGLVQAAGAAGGALVKTMNDKLGQGAKNAQSGFGAPGNIKTADGISMNGSNTAPIKGNAKSDVGTDSANRANDKKVSGISVSGNEKSLNLAAKQLAGSLNSDEQKAYEADEGAQAIANTISSHYGTDNPHISTMNLNSDNTSDSVMDREKIPDQMGMVGLDTNAHLDENGNIQRAADGVQEDTLVGSFDTNKMSAPYKTQMSQMANAFDAYHKADNNLSNLRKANPQAASLVHAAQKAGTDNVAAVRDRSGQVQGFRQQVNKNRAGINNISNSGKHDMKINRANGSVKSSNFMKDALGSHTALGSGGYTSHGGQVSNQSAFNMSAAPAQVQKAVRSSLRANATSLNAQAMKSSSGALNTIDKAYSKNKYQSSNPIGANIGTSAPTKAVSATQTENSTAIQNDGTASTEAVPTQSENVQDNLNPNVESPIQTVQTTNTDQQIDTEVPVQETESSQTVETSSTVTQEEQEDSIPVESSNIPPTENVEENNDYSAINANVQEGIDQGDVPTDDIDMTNKSSESSHHEKQQTDISDNLQDMMNNHFD